MTNTGPVEQETNDIYDSYSGMRNKNKSPFRKTYNVFTTKKIKNGNY